MATRTIHKYGFGMSDISPTMSRRFNNAVNVMSFFLSDRLSPDDVDLDAISELKGMFNRSLRKDQWNWFTVYDRLGCPPRGEMNSIVSRLVKLRESLKEHNFEQALLIRDDLVNGTLPTYLSNWKNHRTVRVSQGKRGWLYVLSTKDEPDILKIGRTTRSVEDRVKEINSATGVLVPYSARAVFQVEDTIAAENLVFNLLSDHRIRQDREFFQIPFSEAAKIIEDKIYPLLIRTQGEVKWFNASKGYGFIACVGHDRDIFVHESQILDTQDKFLQQGQKVKFDLRHTDKGLSAVNVVFAK